MEPRCGNVVWQQNRAANSYFECSRLRAQMTGASAGTVAHITTLRSDGKRAGGGARATRGATGGGEAGTGKGRA